MEAAKGRKLDGRKQTGERGQTDSVGHAKVSWLKWNALPRARTWPLLPQLRGLIL